MALIEDLKKKYKTGNLPIKLIYINVFIFLFVSIFKLIFNQFNIIENLALSSDFSIFVTKPWTIFTYMFLHVRLMHLFFNMIMLWVIGDFFYKYFGDKSFAQFYFLGGILGGMLYIVFDAFYSNHSLLIGASAATYSVLFAMVAYQPELRVRLLFISEPIKLMYVAIGFILLGFIINTGNYGGNISHIGGAIFGYFYMKQFEKGKTLTKYFESFSNLLKFKKKSKLKFEKNSKPPKNDYDYADWKKQKEDKTNLILEKISRSGYNSLTQEEKTFLFKQRRNDK